MVLASAWIFTGVMALLATAVAVATQTRLATTMPNDDAIAIVAGVVGFVTWGIWTFGTLEIVVVADTTKYTFTRPSLTMIGIVWMLVPAYVALTGPVNIIQRARQPDSREL